MQDALDGDVVVLAQRSAGGGLRTHFGGDLGGEEGAQFVAERTLLLGELQVHGGTFQGCRRRSASRDSKLTLHC